MDEDFFEDIGVCFDSSDDILLSGSEGSDVESTELYENLHRTQNGGTLDTVPRNVDAIGGIEDMVMSFLSQLAACGCGSDVRNSEAGCDRAQDANSLANNRVELKLVDRRRDQRHGSPNFRRIRYPRKCPKGSSKPFAQLFRVLDLSHEAIINGIPSTKRDIYYQDTQLFKRQQVVDHLVDDLAATLDLERSDLFIRATSKGLVCGSGMAIHLLTDEDRPVSDSEGTLIPAAEDIRSFTVDQDVSWVLIVEKEAVFQTLCRLKLANHPLLPGRGLIVTGKGYPDLATRHLVKTLADSLPQSVPILALVDGDPYGIDILSVYKYGSKSMQHESAKLAATRIQWLGVSVTELDSYGIDRDHLIPIVERDEQKALAMLRRPLPITSQKWRKELMHMLHLRRKAEIEVFSTATMPHGQAAGTSKSIYLQGTPPNDDQGSANNPLLLIQAKHQPSVTTSPFASPASLTIWPANVILNASTPTYLPLLHYLATKITFYVTKARANSELLGG